MIGPPIALEEGMTVSTHRHSGAGKAVWGRAIVMSLLSTLLVLSTRGARMARRHAKLLGQQARLVVDFAVANGRGNGGRYDQVWWGMLAGDWRLQRLSQEPTGVVVN